ncbi:MAG: hypothetical protein AMS26_22785 [Bacteroides sp. SM23_62]|nr:MAG: hypothetical protein AMS26_22785 [Bacteroides sp. SM23_62]
MRNDYTGNEAAELQAELTKGWSTWYTGSVLSHVSLPEGFGLNLMLMDGQSGDTLERALIGRESFASKEHIIAGPRTYDGSYTELELEWRNIHIRIQSATLKNELYLLITPIKVTQDDSLIIDPGMFWNREGEISIDQNSISGQTRFSTISMYVSGNGTTSDNIKVSLDKAVAISSGESMSKEEVEKMINKAKTNIPDGKSTYKKTPELYNAMQRVLAWNTLYDPINNRAITPVSRNWCVPSGGWVLFEWDTYFAAYMLSLDSKELAYANAIAITKEITDKGFVPNNTQPGIKSLDRSQPPVGAFVVKEIYKNHKEKWLLYELFDDLLKWNRWWADNRDIDGYLSYGTDPYDYGDVYHRSYRGIGKLKGAKWESGLDNSPMYDDVVFDTTIHQMMLADVGLMSLYINECRSLSEIAGVLGKTEIEQELTERAASYSKKLETLWNEEFGLYLNKDLVTGQFSYRLSPTLFYPLLVKVPNQEQATRMMKEHFYNPEEFWGEYIMPSIARNDSAYKDNHYWRGRIWAPMNFLVYLGIRNYELPDAQKDMAEKSKNLLLKSWIGENHVYENYNAETGQGDDAGWSDKFYHWGALLGFIGIMEEGYVASPELPLVDKN